MLSKLQRWGCWTRPEEEACLVLASQNDGREAEKAEGTRFKWSSQFPWWRRLTGALSGVGETYNACLPVAPREPTHEKWKLFAPPLREVEWSSPAGGECWCREHSAGRRGAAHFTGICNSLIHKLCSLWLSYGKIHCCHSKYVYCSYKINLFLEFIFGIELCIFRTVSLSIIRSLVLYTQQ